MSDYEYLPDAYSEMADHMSRLDAALAEVERLQAELDNRIREVIAANRRAEAAETALATLRAQLAWWDA